MERTLGGSWRLIVLAILILAASLLPSQPSQAANASIDPGLRVAFSTPEAGDQGEKDVTVLPNLCLYVPANHRPTPWLPAGRFTAVWSGFVSLDLRSDYRFQAELNGELKLEINGTTVLQAVEPGGTVPPSQSVRLSKGTNRITATFRSPPKGDAFFRVSWIPKGGLPAPIPLNALTHRSDDDLANFNQRRLGRALFLEQRCAKCHPASGGFEGNPESALDAPSFEGIGSRRNQGWMAEWILDPKAQRSSAQMPKLFRGAQAKENAESAAAFLASLKKEEKVVTTSNPPKEDEASGKELFDNLHCAACHNAPDVTATDPQRVSLGHVRRKFAPGMLSAYLQRPEAHFAWIRMPNFKLSYDEARQLAAYLEAHARQPSAPARFASPALVSLGKKFVQSTGCLNCHSLKLENEFSAKPLSALPTNAWNRGCLADDIAGGAASPVFGFSDSERAALRNFAASDRASLSQFAPAEFAHRQMTNLKCQECHGKFDGFPRMEVLGGKLKPEWAAAFIGGKTSYKPRPWIPSRMPAFPAVAEPLAQGWAMLYGYAPRTVSEPSIASDPAKIGQKLVSADGGFSCISCHAVGKAGVTLVFDSPGINLAFVAERLQRPYFERWLYNPLSVDPNTKMPVYFDELGKSSLSDIHDGDGAKQIDAIWQYLRLGEQMPPPAGAEIAP